MISVEIAAMYLCVGVGVFGLIIGSFLNVVIYRVPAGKSLVPASRCPNCDAPVRPWQNVPVLSWLLLRGRCANCKSPISVRYPLVELGTALMFACVALWVLTDSRFHGFTISGIALVLGVYLYLAAISIVLGLIDLDTFRLPNSVVYPSIIVVVIGLTAASFFGAEPAAPLRAAIAAVALVVFYGLLWFVWPGGMGLGDVKLAAVLGFALGWLGWGALIVGSFAAFVLGGIFGVLLMAFGKAGRKSRIPFGPWMLGGAWVGIWGGEYLANWYLRSFIAA